MKTFRGRKIIWKMSKSLILLTFITSVLSNIIQDYPSEMRGGAIFSSISSRGYIALNPAHIVIEREVDTSLLTKAVQQNIDLTNVGKQLCDTITQNIFKNKKDIEKYQEDLKTVGIVEIVMVQNLYIRDQRQACFSLGLDSPEIRGDKTMKLFREKAIETKADKFVAGMHWDQPTGRIRWDSNRREVNEGPFKTITWGGHRKGYSYKTDKWEKDADLVYAASHYPFIYNNPNGEFELRVADDDELNMMFPTICSRKIQKSQFVEVETDVLSELAAHQCKRDIPMMEEHNKIIAKEIKATLLVNFTLLDDTATTSDYLPPMFRSKRSTKSSQNLAKRKELQQMVKDLNMKEVKMIMKVWEENKKLTNKHPTLLHFIYTNLEKALTKNTNNAKRKK